MFPRSNKKIQLGDIVKYGNKTHTKTGRVFKINNVRGGVNYDIYDGESLDNVTSFIRLSADNVATRFRVNCTPIDTDFQFKNYIFLLMTKTRNKTSYYRLIKNSEYNKYIYNFEDIPNYILYFIFINCYWNSPDPNNSVFNKLNDFDGGGTFVNSYNFDIIEVTDISYREKVDKVLTPFAVDRIFEKNGFKVGAGDIVKIKLNQDVKRSIPNKVIVYT
jgi:hypothetical protein